MANNSQISRKRQTQTVMSLIVLIASMAGQAAEAINKLWNILNEDDRLTDAMKKFLDSLKEALKTKDPSERLRKSLLGIEVYLHEQGDISEDDIRVLRERIKDCRHRLDLADSLEGDSRRKVLKTVKKERNALLKQTLARGVATAPDTSK